MVMTCRALRCTARVSMGKGKCFQLVGAMSRCFNTRASYCQTLMSRNPSDEQVNEAIPFKSDHTNYFQTMNLGGDSVLWLLRGSER